MMRKGYHRRQINYKSRKESPQKLTQLRSRSQPRHLVGKSLRFAYDIDALAEEEQELEALVESLNKTCTRYKKETNAEKTKLMKKQRH